MKLNILELSDIEWEESGIHVTSNENICYSSKNNTKHEQVVDIIVEKVYSKGYMQVCFLLYSRNIVDS